MMKERDLGTALRDLAPEPPAIARSVAARDRALNRRARRRASGLVVVAALVAAAVLVPSALFRDDAKEGHPVTSPADISCPAPARRDGPAQRFPAVPGGRLQPGATAVRLCNPGWPTPWLPPREALVTGVDELASMINAAAGPRTGPMSCAAVGGTTWGYQFAYPDGSTTYVHATLAGCPGIYAGSGPRGGKAEVWALYRRFRDLLQAQRAGTEPPALPDVEAACPAPGGTGTWTQHRRPDIVPDLVAMSLCITNTGSYGSRVHTFPLTGPELAMALRDYRENQGGRGIAQSDGTVRISCPHYTYGLSVSALDIWGDRYVFDLGCETFRVTGSTYWRPGQELTALFERLRTGA